MKTMRNLLVSALVAALALVPSAATAGERLMAEYTKEFTGSKSGLEYRYTIKVKIHKTGEPVAGAEFTIATDMPTMPGAHHRPPVKAEPGDHSGTYHATIDFVMVGAWNLILRFTKPHRDQIVLTDTVLMQAGGKGQEPMRMEHGTGQMKHDPGKMKQMN